MTDQLDPRDDELTGRLRSQELRVPVSAAPSIATAAKGKPRWLAFGLAVAGLAVVLAVAIPRLTQPVAGEPSVSASASASFESSRSESVQPSATPTVEATATTEPMPAQISDIAWTSLAWNEDLSPEVVAYDDVLELWFAFAGRRVWTSPDGRAWTEGDSLPTARCDAEESCSGGSVSSVSRLGETLVAVGGQGNGGADVVEVVVWMTSDGAHWSLSDLPQEWVGQHPAETAVSGGILAILNAIATDPQAGTTVLTTSDGVSWTVENERAVRIVRRVALQALSGGNDGFIAAGYNVEYPNDSDAVVTPRIYASSTGTDWSLVTTGLPDAGSLESVVRNPAGRYIAAGPTRDQSGVQVWASNADGEPWTVHVLPVRGQVESIDGWEGVRVVTTPHGSIVVTNVPDGMQAWTSADGASWSSAAVPDASPGQRFRAVAAHGDLVIAFGATVGHAGHYPTVAPFVLWVGEVIGQ